MSLFFHVKCSAAFLGICSGSISGSENCWNFWRPQFLSLDSCLFLLSEHYEVNIYIVHIWRSQLILFLYHFQKGNSIFTSQNIFRHWYVIFSGRNMLFKDGNIVFSFEIVVALLFAQLFLCNILNIWSIIVACNSQILTWTILKNTEDDHCRLSSNERVMATLK